jgi:hypothetical protein
MNAIPSVELQGKWHVAHSAKGLTVKGRITNSSNTPAIAVRMTLRNADTGKRVLPVYYDDNYFSLLPGESKEFEITSTEKTGDVRVALDGWNIKPMNLGENQVRGFELISRSQVFGLRREISTSMVNRQRIFASFEKCENVFQIVNTSRPRSAPGQLQGGPKFCVLRQCEVRREVFPG